MKRVDMIVAQALLGSICENACGYPYTMSIEAIVNRLSYLPQSEREVIKTYLTSVSDAVSKADALAVERKAEREKLGLPPVQ